MEGYGVEKSDFVKVAGKTYFRHSEFFEHFEKSQHNHWVYQMFSFDKSGAMKCSNGDFGKRDDPQGRVGDNDAFLEFFKASGGDGIFVGHYHKNCTSILSDGVRYTFGLKTGVYDYHNSDMIGGTLITLTGENGGAPGENGGAHDESGGAHGETAGRPGFSVKHLYTRLKDDFWERLERACE